MLDEQKEKSDAFCKAETDKMKAWENATSKLTEKRMKIKEEHISFLTKRD